MPSSVLHYDRLTSIGKGTYGVVYKARDTRTKGNVALKRIFMDEGDDGVSATTIREIGLLKHMKHPNIVQIKDVFFHHNDVYIVFALSKSDLKGYLNKFIKRSPLKMGKIKKLTFQILSGINYMHSVGIMHRDIKPQNILIDHNTEEIRITDFGLSRTYILPNRTWTHEVITLWYRPPEVLMGCGSYSVGVDMWSIACVIAEMLNNNRALFTGQSEITQLFAIFKSLGTPTTDNWPQVHEQCKQMCAKFPKWQRKKMKNLAPREDFDEQGQDLLDSMFKLDPIKRIIAKDALSHPWFQR